MTLFHHAVVLCALTLGVVPSGSLAQSQGVVPQTLPCTPHQTSDCFPVLVVTDSRGKTGEIPIDKNVKFWRNMLSNSTIPRRQVDRQAASVIRAATQDGATKGIEQTVSCGGGVSQTPSGTGGTSTCTYTIKWGKGVGK